MAFVCEVTKYDGSVVFFEDVRMIDILPDMKNLEKNLLVVHYNEKDKYFFSEDDVLRVECSFNRYY